MSGAVSKTWNSINPATLSGAIDVIVVEHPDGLISLGLFAESPLTLCRHTCMLSISRSLRQILSSPAIRQESRVSGQ